MNDIIIIGNDHHNTLNTARCFGKEGISPYGIILCKNDIKHGFCELSRYWKKVWYLKEDEVVQFLLDSFLNHNPKPVLFPCCDTAAAIIDSQFNQLRHHFHMPSMSDKEGKIVELMDKAVQVELARKYNLPMAKGWVINLLETSYYPSDIVFPCIVKPLSSYEGEKADIRKIENSAELSQYLLVLKEKGYKRILVQEYLTFDFELEFVGCVSPTDNAFLISRNIREWPIIGGTNSFFCIINDPYVVSTCEKVMRLFQEMHYNGLFDVEMFYINGTIYINEFNWRNTGNIFFSHGTGVNYAVIWVFSQIGKDTSPFKHYCDDTNLYAMNEATDIRHVVFSSLPFKEWNRDRKKTSSFALWYKGDMRPVIKRYFQLILRLFFNKRSRRKTANGKM